MCLAPYSQHKGMVIIMKKRLVCIILMISFVLPLVTFGATALGADTAESTADAPDLNDAARLEDVADLVEKINAYVKKKAATKSSSGRQLSVPLYQQQEGYYCGPASVQMVLKYLTGTTYSQATLANSMGTAENGGTYVYRIRNELNSRTSAGNYQYLGTWEASFSDSLIYSIDKNKPVICHVKTGILPNYNYASNTGHYIVSTGYYVAYSGSSATATCRYNDPHNNNSFYGTYNCDISTMTTAINNNAGYYISGT